MPSVAPTWNTWLKASAIGSRSEGSPNELLTMLAMWALTMKASAASRSDWLQLAPATKLTLASGAWPCTDSTSRVSSGYQPAAPHWAVPEKLDGRYWWYWPVANGLSPTVVAKGLASGGIDGDAEASTRAPGWA